MGFFFLVSLNEYALNMKEFPYLRTMLALLKKRGSWAATAVARTGKCWLALRH